MTAVRAHFRPEFVNRIDEIVVFHRLGEAHIGADRRASRWSSCAAAWPTAASGSS